MRSKKIQNLTVDAMFLAIMVIMTFVPSLGFISIGGAISITLLHIVVLIGAIYKGWKRGLLYGFYFGMLSLLKAAIAPVSVLDPYFVNPLISVLPRVAFGLIAGLAFDFIRRIKSNVLKSVLIPVNCFLMTMVHSVLVLTFLGLFGGTEVMPGYWGVMAATLASSSIAEALAASIIVLPVSIAICNNLFTVKNEKDHSEAFAMYALYVAYLPILPWVISGFGLLEAKHFKNERAMKKNREAFIISILMFILLLVLYMLIHN